MRTVNEMSKLTGISVRTLHYYDAIDLLKPTRVGENGYRFYDDESLKRLQSILLYRELEFPLKKIKEIMDSPAYIRDEALLEQITFLEEKQAHLHKVIAHAKAIQGGNEMSEFDVYDQEVKERWGDTEAFQEYQGKAGKINQEQVAADMQAIFAEFGNLQNEAVASPLVQVQVKKLQVYITANFYTCTKEILAGLGQLYTEDERFKANIDKMGGSGTAEFAGKAIETYCQSA
ncbi:MerR family transcriptional regulator [Streptococcus hongkongensis]|nr:MerR family transcriptional regulator [Streptococcus uberis]